jgi:uncharacterized protein YqeY
MSLLEEAKKVQVSLRRPLAVSDEEIEIIMAYLNNELADNQMRVAISRNFTAVLGSRISILCRSGKYKLVKVK